MKKRSTKFEGILLIALFGIGTILCCTSQRPNHTSPSVTRSALERSFMMPPDTIQTSVYWYWMSDNISREGVVKDLYAMKSVGINRAFIGNIGHESTAYGKIKLFSKDWWDILHTALKTATALGIEIGIFNSPGWSQSGGPWVKPSQTMRYLNASEIKLVGGKRISIDLEQPNELFQDVKVLAFKAPKDYQSNVIDFHPVLSSIPRINHLESIIDKDHTTGIDITDTGEVCIDFNLEREFTARSITIYPAHYPMTAKAKLQVKEHTNYRTIKIFDIDRRRDALNVGFDPYAPIVMSLPITSARTFRLLIKKSVIANKSFPKFGISEVQLSSSPKVEQYAEKTFAKMFQAPLPYWYEYQWPLQPTEPDQGLVISPNQVLDISRYMSSTGHLEWDAPTGDWVVMRMGMTPTGVKNSPASLEGTGLEIDKMNKQHIGSHFEAFIGEIIKRIPPEDRKTWKVVVQDSYETGGQNWTDEMLGRFKASFGYDPFPYLPALFGKVVGSPDQSDRFLWDLRRFIADRVAYDYVGGLREISHKHGLTTWLENYGHWGFPGEFLQYGGQSDEVAGEFWGEGELGNIENRAASSAAHIYGKTKVSAESFTAGGKAYIRYPGLVKQRGDRFFTEGINNTLLHLYIQQPDERVPGVNANFNMEFNRHNTWFSYLDLFTIYLKRCNLMLQQGKYVVDVAYFIGEDAPKMTGITDPSLPLGYSFDYINAEVLQNKASVRNGRIFLPDGMNYGVLVLPRLETMRPELLVKIRELVREGAVITGPAPKRSPSLSGFPNSDQSVLDIASELWGDVNGGTITSHPFGKGRVFLDKNLSSILQKVNIAPDFTTNIDSVLFIHRTTPDTEIYFVSNQKRKKVNFNSHFRIDGKQPELWDPVSGMVRKLPEFETKNGITTIPLQLESLESVFIIFKKQESLTAKSSINYPKACLTVNIISPWQVTFDEKMRGPDTPVIYKTLSYWRESDDNRIKYYSGTAIYRNKVTLGKLLLGKHYYLNLGEVKSIAKIKVNGIDVGGVWTAPLRVEITKAIKKGVNEIEISVANTWANRLIGDSMLPVNERKTWTNENPFKPNSPLESGGLKGPVTVIAVEF